MSVFKSRCIDCEYSGKIDCKIVFESNVRAYTTDRINEILKHVAKGCPVNKRLKSL
jgi:hypothetical protein